MPWFRGGSTQTADSKVTIRPPVTLFLTIGAFNALQASLLSAVALALASPLPRGWSPDIGQVLRVTPLLLPITFVSFGSYGFLAGFAGSAWINRRRKRIWSMKRLLLHCLALGFLFTVAFPFFDILWNLLLSASTYHRSPLQLLSCMPIGMTCALSTAMVFRKHLIA